MIVGITGSIAMGKSIVTNYLKQKGYEVIDSDLLARQALDNVKIINQLKEHFGPSIIIDDKIDRKLLGRIIFNNSDERKFLNSVVHPEVIKKIKEKTFNMKGLIFVDIPLLFEVNLENLVDKIIVVYTSKKTQLKRLIERDNISKDFANQKINSQMNIELKKEKANFLINNEQSLEETYKQIDEIIRRIKNEI